MTVLDIVGVAFIIVFAVVTFIWIASSWDDKQ